MNIWTSFGAIVLAASAGMTAFPDRALSEEPAVEVSIPRGTPARVTDDMANRFAAANPGLSVNYQLGSEEWTGLLQETLRGAVVGELPDVSHQSLNHVRVLVDQGLVVPLDPFIEEAGGWEALGYLPRLRETATIEGKIYAIPFATTVPLVFYNRDLLAQAGYENDGLPETWDEIFEAAQGVNALGEDIIGIYMEADATSAWMFQTLLLSLGGQMMNEDETDIAFDSPEGLKALQILKRHGDAGQIDMSDNQARQQFMAGGIGIYIRSASILPRFTEAAEGNFAFDAGQLPIPAEGASLPGAGNGLVMLAADEARQRAAWRYMTFAAGAEGQEVLVDTTGYAPTNRRAAEDSEALQAFYQENPYHRLVVDRFPVISDWYAFPGDNSARIFDRMIDEQLDVIAGRTTPEDALSNMAETARELLP